MIKKEAGVTRFQRRFNTENCLKPQPLGCGSCLTTSSFLSPKIPNPKKSPRIFRATKISRFLRKPHTLVCGKIQEFYDSKNSKIRRRLNSKSAQAWVETVVYTLIGLTIMGIIIGIATPKIKQMTDKAILEQTMTAMNEIDQKVNIVQTAQGQSREINIRIKKGKFVVNSMENKLSFVLEGTGLKYSQPGTLIRQGDLVILTEEQGKKYDISLTLDYSSDIDITFDSADEDKVLTQAPTAYRMLIENKGGGNLDVTLI